MMTIASKKHGKEIKGPGIKKTKSATQVIKGKDNEKKKLSKALKSGLFSEDAVVKAKKLLEKKEDVIDSVKAKKKKRELDDSQDQEPMKKKVSKLNVVKKEAKMKKKGKEKELKDSVKAKNAKQELNDSQSEEAKKGKVPKLKEVKKETKMKKKEKKEELKDSDKAKKRKRELDDSQGQETKKQKVSKLKEAQKEIKTKKNVKENGKKQSEEDVDEGNISKRRQKIKSILANKGRAEGLSKKERRALRVEKRKDGDLVGRLLAMWEELRVTSCPPERRSELCNAIIGQSVGKIASLVLSHDTCRVFETVLKTGTEEQRIRVLEEIEGVDTMCGIMRSKFGKFLIHKMLQYGSGRHKERVFKALQGNVLRLLQHRQAIYVLNAAFNDFATASQRSSILQETYGPPFSVLKEPGVNKLKEAFAASPKTNRDTVLAFLKDVLTKVIAKSNVNYVLVHSLLSDFLEMCNDADRSEICGSLKEHIVALLHTRDGVKTAMTVLWQSNNKDRKAILRTLKTFFANTACDEHGHLFIMACLDAVDDIVLLSKSLIKEILESMDKMVESQHGRKVLLYMLSRRKQVHFHPQLLDILKKGDSNPYTKKSTEIRDRELRERVLSPLLTYVCANISSVCSPNNALQLLRELLVVAASEKSEKFSELVLQVSNLLVDGTAVCADGSESLTENSGAHVIMKKALQESKDEEISVGRELLTQFEGKDLRPLLLTNRGCFLLVTIIETTPGAAEKLSASLKDNMDTLNNQKTPGAAILKKKLK